MAHAAWESAAMGLLSGVSNRGVEARLAQGTLARVDRSPCRSHCGWRAGLHGHLCRKSLRLGCRQRRGKVDFQDGWRHRTFANVLRRVSLFWFDGSKALRGRVAQWEREMAL